MVGAKTKITPQFPSQGARLVGSGGAGCKKHPDPHRHQPRSRRHLDPFTPVNNISTALEADTYLGREGQGPPVRRAPCPPEPQDSCPQYIYIYINGLGQPIRKV